MKPDSELLGLLEGFHECDEGAPGYPEYLAAIESLFERRIAELEAENADWEATNAYAARKVQEYIQRISLLEAARNDLLLVVEELNDLRKTAEANSLTREEWDMVISRLSTHDVRFGLSEKPAQLFRKLHALRLLSEEKP